MNGFSAQNKGQNQNNDFKYRTTTAVEQQEKILPAVMANDTSRKIVNQQHFSSSSSNSINSK